MELLPGLVVGNKVRLERMLGEGGMGSVWLATHLTLQTSVAVKFISLDLAANDMAQRRFTSEAMSAAQIKSPHVVQVLDHGMLYGRPYIVMELLEGEDLAARIERVKQLPIAETAEIIRQAAKGLTAAHALGIIHRDIKPANIFLTQSAGEIFVKVLDFGIAKRATDDNYAKTATGTMVGTPYYMSPEQVIEEGTSDHRSDVWALAVTAYECLTGALPFTGAQLGAIYIAIHSGKFARPTSLNPTLPIEIDAFFERALAKNPEQRFASARDLADALAAIGLGSTRNSFSAISPSSPGAPRSSDAAFAKTDLRAPQTLAGTSSDSFLKRRGKKRAAVLIGVGAAVLAGIGVVVIVGLSGHGASSQGSQPTEAATEHVTDPSSPSSAPNVIPSGAAPDIAPTPSGASVAPPPPDSASAAPSTKPVEQRPTAVTTSSAKPAVSSHPGTAGTVKRRDHGF